MTRVMLEKIRFNIPHMEYFFDEITEKLTIRCPNSNKLVNVEAVRRSHSEHSPFVDVIYCEGCGNVARDVDEHLIRVNRIYYHH